jgi:hypothetical protein
MSLAPVPEVRDMVEVAKRFVAGEVHFSHMVAPTQACLLWAKVHGTDPAIQELAAKWHLLADRVWNEFGQHGLALPVEEFRRVVAADLGIASDAEPGGTPDTGRSG